MVLELMQKEEKLFLGGINLAEACQMSLKELVIWIHEVVSELPDGVRQMAENILEEFMDNASILLDLGLSYISLDRPANTLSTGELAKMQLAKTLRNHTTGVLYVLDEPSIGLHPDNVNGLISVIRHLVDDGNSIILVDHDTKILGIADYIGLNWDQLQSADGGNIIAMGTLDEIKVNESSQIAPFFIKFRKNYHSG